MSRLLAALLFAAFMLAICPPPLGAATQVTVTATRLNVRESPGTEARVLGAAARGDRLEVLEEKPGWFKVRAAGGLEGWVSASFVEAVAAPEKAAEPAREPERVKEERPPAPRPAGSGISAGRKVLKYGTLAGAAVAGILAYGEHSSGNDTYDEYKELARAGNAPAAEAKYDETTDHDGKAKTYAIVAGVLAGAYLAQEFWLERGAGSDRASIEGPLRFSWDLEGRRAGAAVVLARF